MNHSLAAFGLALGLVVLPVSVVVADGSPEYVGRAKCASCHPVEERLWAGSDHDRAMQRVSDSSVLGDFTGVEFEHFGQVSRFLRRDGDFIVHTDGPDGRMEDFKVAYTFGVYPLQQYLVEFPGGRLQALDIAWDSRSASAGGQRWFHLHPDEPIGPGDVLHWTGPNLNWNYMCADCHSTNLRKNYDPGTGAYATEWSAIDVSCEACHGPGADHLRWAEGRAAGEDIEMPAKGLTVALHDRRGVHWSLDRKTGKPVRSVANDHRAEVEVCARCHSRRSQLGDDFVPGQRFMDAYRPALLRDGLYYPDGQMRDEVYVWGSFRQSAMYKAGVTCSDCHDPHSTALKSPPAQPAGVCYQCHPADRYAQRSHHFHKPGSSGADCVGCHMPATTYMGVDDRHDHSFRVPRPAETVRFEVPNACNRCHRDRPPSWAAAQVEAWYGGEPSGLQQFTPALDAAYRGLPSARRLLVGLAADPGQPAIARASALAEFTGGLDRNRVMLLQRSIEDPDPMVRLGALVALGSAGPRERVLGFALLWDPVRAIRLEAARLMAVLPEAQIPQQYRAKRAAAVDEYVRAQRFNAERPEAQINLAGLYADLGQHESAEVAFREALRQQPQFVPAYVRFARWLDGRGRAGEGIGLLRAGIERMPDIADLHQELGLALVRSKRSEEALSSLATAARLAPENRRYQYVYAVALQSAGRIDDALEVLRRSHRRYPADPEVLYALATFNRDAGRRGQALAYARKLAELLPGDSGIARLVGQLQ